ncbi:GntR family transcriptional regulator [Kiloniella sp.]|uniref:GntR family transcriptional regulator n=1 Tax=Kiloniella sp. TaxID=1938587 RepID=UPI003B02A09B
MKEDAKKGKGALYGVLKKEILTMVRRPGSDLDEAQLAEEFSVSRTPLREVFRQLAGEGYVELRENRGARISDMSHTTLRDFFLTAPMIYGAVMRLAARNARPDQIDDLKATQELFKDALRTGASEDRALSNNRFHEITGDMADNIYLKPSFKRLLIDHARIGMTFYQPQDTHMEENLTAASSQHDAIITAIENRDEASAAQLATDHWNLSKNQIELFVMPNQLDIPLGSPSLKAARG